MANQPPWRPYRPPGHKNYCSLCSVYCPQWCYYTFPPSTLDPFNSVPVPVPVSDSNTISRLSPAVIAIVTLIIVTFLLSICHSIVKKLRRHQLHHHQQPTTVVDAIQRSPPKGLDESLINRIGTFKFTKGASGFVKGASCSVCLGEFCHGESLRMLPKCSHVFHVRCIDAWLRSRPSCPLCRAGIVWASSPPPLPTIMPRESEGGRIVEVDRPNLMVTNQDYGSVLKDPLMRRWSSVGSSSRRCSSEDQLAGSSAMECGNEGTILRMKPVAMVRSLSCGGGE